MTDRPIINRNLIDLALIIGLMRTLSASRDG
jgi:hypothetical protein